MSEIAIVVESLSKQYRIGRAQQRHDTLRDAIVGTFQRLASGHSLARQANDEYIWALKDVCFEVGRGEVLGIIGRNGAGKSTLLKILSRITEPTEGRAMIHGRVGSLLEVGTGFHPELTGRENIHLNGAILGMKRAEIDRRFDEIVTFAEVEKFIDTPVKRYSSGMYVRLAFSVAAHLDPEILLVDEVLAVGDAAFQKKCLGKMGDVAQEGRTVLFVSHNMAAVSTLTERVVYLKDGRIAADGIPSKAIDQYLWDAQGGQVQEGRSLDLYRREFSADAPIKTTDIAIDGLSGELPVIKMGEAFTIRVQVQVTEAIRGAHIDIALKNARGERVALLFSRDQGYTLCLEPGEHVISVHVDSLTLAPGLYSADVGINQSMTTKAYDLVLDYPIFRVACHEGISLWVNRPWGAVHCDRVTWYASKCASRNEAEE